MNFFVKGYSLDELRDLTYECKVPKMQFDNPFERDIFTIPGSYHKYVEEQKPFTAVIIGKPCEEISKVGRILASKLNSFYIDPTTVLNNHMRQNQRIGQWIYANLVNGKKIPVDVMLKLMALELTRMKYQFYGYILGGLPILPSFEVSADMIPPIFQNVLLTEVPRFRNRRDDDFQFQDAKEEGGIRQDWPINMAMSSSDIFEKVHKGVKEIVLEMDEEECEEEEEYKPDMDDDLYNEMVNWQRMNDFCLGSFTSYVISVTHNILKVLPQHNVHQYPHCKYSIRELPILIGSKRFPENSVPN